MTRKPTAKAGSTAISTVHRPVQDAKSTVPSPARDTAPALSDRDLAKVCALASQSRRPAVIAAALGVTRSAFLELLKTDPAALEAFETGKDLARDSYVKRLERAAFDPKTGRLRNVTAAIWYGKCVLGFTETSGQQSPAPPGKHIHFHMPAPMTMDELRALNAGGTIVPGS